MSLFPTHLQMFAHSFESAGVLLIHDLRQPLGSELLVEKWIYHKLDVAVTDVNEALYERNFMAATNAVYNFWLYELCDVYIVSTTSFSVGTSLIQ
jgi:valyl-tRNA synthetase